MTIVATDEGDLRMAAAERCAAHAVQMFAAQALHTADQRRTSTNASFLEIQMTLVRNKRIVALREEGRTFNEISAEVGFSIGYIANQYYRHCPRPGDEELPDDMSVVSAREVKAVLGAWPSLETAEMVAARIKELLRSSRRRATIVETIRWLERLGLGWGAPNGWKP